MTANIATLAPIPRASVTTAVAVCSGLRVIVRPAKRRSRTRISQCSEGAVRKMSASVAAQSRSRPTPLVPDASARKVASISRP